jgi:hypothetical protein
MQLSHLISIAFAFIASPLQARALLVPAGLVAGPDKTNASPPSDRGSTLKFPVRIAKRASGEPKAIRRTPEEWRAAAGQVAERLNSEGSTTGLRNTVWDLVDDQPPGERFSGDVVNSDLFDVQTLDEIREGFI